MLQGLEENDTTRNLDPQRHLQPETRHLNEGFSGAEFDDNAGLRETREQSGSKNERQKTDETSHGCPDCGKTFKQKTDLTRHIRIHTGEKPFTCFECGRSFNEKGTLTKHMLVHTQEKPFSCSYCSKRFNHKSNLKCHMARHRGETPFSCSVCEKRFVRKSSLTSHMLVHTGEKPFRCSFCSRRFNQKANLKLHLAHHRGEKLYSCSVCQQRFSWHCQLKSHKCDGGQASELHQNQSEENGESKMGAKEEKEELWRSQKGEHLHGWKDADSTTLPLSSVSVKRDDDEMKHQFSKLHQRQIRQMKTGTFGKDSRGVEDLKTDGDEETKQSALNGDCSEGDFWKKRRQHHSGFTYERKKTASINNECNLVKNSILYLPNATQSDLRKNRHLNIDLCSKQKHLQADPNFMKHKEMSESCAETSSSGLLVPHKESSQSSQLYQKQTKERETEAEPARSSDPERLLLPGTEFKTEDSSGHETDIGLEQRETREDKLSHSQASEHHFTRKGVSQHVIVYKGAQRGAKQEDSEPPLVKEEQEEVTINRSDCTLFPFTPVSVKTEDDEEKPQSSQLHQSQTEQIETGADGEDFRGAEPARSSDPERHFLSDTGVKTEDSAGTDDSVGSDFWTETRERRPNLSNEHLNEEKPFCPSDNETDDSEDWRESEKHQSGLDFVEKMQNKTSVTEKKYSCTECGKVLKRKYNLLQHLRIHTGEKPFSCPECGKRFNEQGNLTRHVYIHKEEKPFSCSNCSKRFYNKSNLIRHMVIHREEKPFGCSVCNKRFKLKVILKTHMSVHRGEKPFCCSECGKKFQRKGNLAQHVLIHKGIKPFRCPFCGKVFNRKGSLKTHVLVHTGEEPFSCSECGKTFKQKTCLTSHMFLHSGEKPFTCSVCFKRFTQKGSLTRHMLVHTGEEPFRCSECGKTFNQKACLTRHLLVHKGEKPFSCSKCSRSFKRKGGLTRHMSLHTGQEPFNCSECGKGFYHQSDLVRHMLVHREEKPFSCFDCGKGFNQKGTLTRHILIHKKEKLKSSSVSSKKCSFPDKFKAKNVSEVRLQRLRKNKLRRKEKQK